MYMLIFRTTSAHDQWERFSSQVRKDFAPLQDSSCSNQLRVIIRTRDLENEKANAFDHGSMVNDHKPKVIS